MKSIEDFKYAFASEIGTSHINSNTAKQDYCLVKEFSKNSSKYLICCVADGAGSAKYSDLSSKFISKLFTKKAISFLKENTISSLNKEVVSFWFCYFQKVILRAVRFYKLNSKRDFATTLLFCVLNSETNIFVQIGDGFISSGNFEKLDCIFIPQNGEYLNTTNFATDDDVLNKFMYKKDDEKFERLILSTDGIELISFDFTNNKPHLKFFNPFFDMLEKTSISGFNFDVSKFISGFLNCQRVNQNTDDDKTMLIISRIKNFENEAC